MSKLNELRSSLEAVIRDVPDFPKEGILFKDITPLLSNPSLCKEIADYYGEGYQEQGIDAVAGMESRGFLFGMMLAERLNVPFIPIRKAGKLPYDKVQYSYELEYGEATLEVHTDALNKGDRVLIHDDLLATGGTACAAAELIHQIGGEVHSYFFLIELGFLDGQSRLKKYTDTIDSIISY